MGMWDDFKNFASGVLQAASEMLQSTEQKLDDAKSAATNAAKSALEDSPADKTGKLTPVDQLYKMAGKDGFPEGDYQSLIAMLSKINSDIVNNFSVSHHEYTDSSYLAATRSQRDRAGEPKTLKKNKVYGVVLKSIIRGSDKVIYIDVPPWNTKLINHPDDISTLNEKQLKEYEDLVFFPESSTFSAPSPLRLAVVEIPANFPNHTITNPQDAVYKQLYSSDKIIQSSTKQEKVNTSTENNLPLTNNSTSSDDANYKQKKIGFFVIKTNYDSTIKEASSETGVPEDWIKAFIAVESGFNPDAVSPTGVRGLMQTTKATFSDQSKKPIFKKKFASATLDRSNPEQSIYVGALLLKDLRKMYNNDLEKVAAAYNWGPGNIKGDNWKDNLRLETKNYIKKIPAALKAVQEFNKIDAQDTKQSAPVAQQSESNSQTGKTASLAVNKPKMLLVNFEVDTVADSAVYNRGSNIIKVREDIVPDLKQIKKILNNYNIPFTCNAINIDLNNKNLSDFARVGLEINLNINAALTTNSTDDDVYYVSQSKNNNLQIYAQARKNLEYIDQKYTPVSKQIEIYNIRNTFSKRPPELKKIFKPVLDLTKIFEDFGFQTVKPDYLFFSKSDNIKSNWFVFYKPAKLNIGYSYKELLATIYYNNNEQIWDNADKKWDGKKFS